MEMQCNPTLNFKQEIDDMPTVPEVQYVNKVREQIESELAGCCSRNLPPPQLVFDVMDSEEEDEGPKQTESKLAGSCNGKLPSPQLIFEVLDSEEEEEDPKRSFDNVAKSASVECLKKLHSDWNRDEHGRSCKDSLLTSTLKTEPVVESMSESDDYDNIPIGRLMKKQLDTMSERANKASSSPENLHSQSLACGSENFKEVRSPIGHGFLSLKQCEGNHAEKSGFSYKEHNPVAGNCEENRVESVIIGGTNGSMVNEIPTARTVKVQESRGNVGGDHFTEEKKTKSKRHHYYSTTCSPSKVHCLFQVVMSEEDRLDFEGTCFGPLLKIPPLAISRTLIAAVMRYWVRGDLFDFDGFKLRCSLKDIRLILGLSVAKAQPLSSTDPKNPTEFRKKYLPYSTSTLTSGMILKAIADLKKKEIRTDEEEEDLKKLYMLYLLPNLLLPNKARIVEHKYVDLANNFEKFNNHPWGRDVHRGLVSAFEHIYDRLGTNHFSMFGCIAAFQVWCYMHIPRIAPKKLDHVYPRLFAWEHRLVSKGKGKGYRTLKKHEQEVDKKGYRTLKEHEEEVDKAVRNCRFVDHIIPTPEEVNDIHIPGSDDESIRETRGPDKRKMKRPWLDDSKKRRHGRGKSSVKGTDVTRSSSTNSYKSPQRKRAREVEHAHEEVEKTFKKVNTSTIIGKREPSEDSMGERIQTFGTVAHPSQETTQRFGNMTEREMRASTQLEKHREEPVKKGLTGNGGNAEKRNNSVRQSVGMIGASKVVSNGAEAAERTLEQATSIPVVAGVEPKMMESATHVSNYLVERSEESEDDEYGKVEEDRVEENTSVGVEDENNEIVAFGGGPTNMSVLYQFKDHIACKLWDKEAPTVLSCSNHYMELTSWDLENEHVVVQKIVRDSGLVNLSKFPKHDINHAIITAFVERWHGETNTFHLPFGEMTITLDDIHHITGLPIGGMPLQGLAGQGRSVDRKKLTEYLVDGIGATEAAAEKEMIGCKVYSVTSSWIRDNCCPISVQTNDGLEKRARGYLFWLLGNTIMSDNFGDRIPIYLLATLMNLDKVRKFNWSAGLLALLYQQLTQASYGSRHIASYVPVIEVWINDHFWIGGMVEPDFVEGQPHIGKWMVQVCNGNADNAVLYYREFLDDLSAEKVVWDPFSDKRDRYPLQEITWFTGALVMFDNAQAYNPGRVLRQMGRVQCIPKDPVRNGKGGNYARCCMIAVLDHLEDWENHLLGESRRMVPVRQSWDCTPTYIDWFLAISHPYVQNPKSRRTAPRRHTNDGKHKMALWGLDDGTHADVTSILKRGFDPNIEERCLKMEAGECTEKDVAGGPNNKKARAE